MGPKISFRIVGSYTDVIQCVLIFHATFMVKHFDIIFCIFAELESVATPVFWRIELIYMLSVCALFSNVFLLMKFISYF